METMLRGKLIKGKLMEVLILISIVFGIITGLIAYLLNLAFNVGNTLEIILISTVSGILTFLFVCFAIIKAIKKTKVKDFSSFENFTSDK